MPTADYENRVEQTLTAITDSEQISEENLALVKEYKRDQVLNGLSNATLAKNLSRLKVLAEYFGDTSFKAVDKEGMKDLIEWIHSQDYTDATIYTHKNVIRSFWTWLNPTEEGEAPPEVAWIKLQNPSSGSNTLPKDLLTKEDIEAQIAACNNERDKAFVSILYETGARVGEVIDLTVGDIEDRKHGKKVVVEGKTGARRIPLVESVPYLNKWLNKHPNPSKDAPLWCKFQQGGPTKHLNPNEVEDIREVYGIGPSRADQLNEAGIKTGADLVDYSAEELADITGVRSETAAKWLKQFDSNASLTGETTQLGYRYIRDKILAKTMEEAGIDKPSNPHHYRHSRASYLANHLKEAQLCEWFGWVQGSDVPARYVHLSGRDLDDAYDQTHGLYEPEEEEEEPQVQECKRCDELNEPGAAYCMRCGFALDQEEAEDFEAEVQDDLKGAYRDVDPEDMDLMEKISLMDELADDPEIKRMLHGRLS